MTGAQNPYDFDAWQEPLRAIRDLITMCEGLRLDRAEGENILCRAREAFTAIRAEFGDTRTGEEIAEAPMHEPRGLRAALTLTAAALQAVAPSIPNGERHVITFNGRWEHVPSAQIGQILDRADAALEPFRPAPVTQTIVPRSPALPTKEPAACP